MSDAAGQDLVHQMSLSAVKAAPPALVSLYALISKGLPFVISFLTLVYLSIQISHLCWTWIGEARRKSELAKAGHAAPSPERTLP